MSGPISGPTSGPETGRGSDKSKLHVAASQGAEPLPSRCGDRDGDGEVRTGTEAALLAHEARADEGRCPAAGRSSVVLTQRIIALDPGVLDVCVDAHVAQGPATSAAASAGPPARSAERVAGVGTPGAPRSDVGRPGEGIASSSQAMCRAGVASSVETVRSVGVPGFSKAARNGDALVQESPNRAARAAPGRVSAATTTATPAFAGAGGAIDLAATALEWGEDNARSAVPSVPNLAESVEAEWATHSSISLELCEAPDMWRRICSVSLEDAATLQFKRAGAPNAEPALPPGSELAELDRILAEADRLRNARLGSATDAQDVQGSEQLARVQAARSTMPAPGRLGTAGADAPTPAAYVFRELHGLGAPVGDSARRGTDPRRSNRVGVFCAPEVFRVFGVLGLLACVLCLLFVTHWLTSWLVCDEDSSLDVARLQCVPRATLSTPAVR